MRRLLVLVLAAGTLAALPASVGGAQSEPPPPVPAPGDVGPGTADYAVGRRTIEIVAAPDRTLTVDVWYPVDEADAAGVAPSVYEFPGISYPSSVALAEPVASADGPFPLVVYSHGSGGLRYVAAFFTEALAARGFVVAAPEHTGNTAIDAVAGTAATRKEVARLRPADVQSTITGMLAASADPADPMSGRIDEEKIGVTGHSAGGYGVFTAVAGFEDVPADPRIDAVVAMAPVVPPEAEDVDVPTMVISGTLDTATTIAEQTERAWKIIPGRPLYRVDLKGAGHQSFSDVCFYEDLLPSFPELPDLIVDYLETFAAQACTPKFLEIEEAHRLIDRYAIGFLERYVAGDRSAAKLLKRTEPKIVQLQVKR